MLHYEYEETNVSNWTGIFEMKIQENYFSPAPIGLYMYWIIKYSGLPDGTL